MDGQDRCDLVRVVYTSTDIYIEWLRWFWVVSRGRTPILRLDRISCLSFLLTKNLRWCSPGIPVSTQWLIAL